MHRICVIQRNQPLLDEVSDSFSLFRSSASAAGYHPGRVVGAVPDLRIEGSGHRRLII